MKTKFHQDVWAGCGILVFCCFFALLTLGKPRGTMTFPIILLSIMTILSIPILVAGVRKTRASAETPMDNDIQWAKLKAPLTAFLFIAGYVFLFWLVGYFVATLLFLPATMYHFRMKNPLLSGLVSIGYAVLIYALFVRQLNVPVLNFGYLEKFANFM